MTGGAGADTFVFDIDQRSPGNGWQRHQNHGENLNTATVTDFTPGQDKLQFDATIRQVHLASDHHGGTLVYAGNEQIDLLGVQQGELSIHRDFILRSGAPANGTGYNSDSTIALLGQHIAATLQSLARAKAVPLLAALSQLKPIRLLQCL